MHCPWWYIPLLTVPMLIAVASVLHVLVSHYAVGGGLFLALVVVGGLGWYAFLPESARAALVAASAPNVLMTLIFAVTIAVFVMLYLGPYRNPGWLSLGFAILFLALGVAAISTGEFIREAVRKPYHFGAWPAATRDLMLGGPLAVLTILTAVAPGLPWLLILAQRQGATRTLALLTGLAQLAVLALNVVSRQVVQNAELGRFLDVAGEPVSLQWSPLVVLVMFVAGLGVVFWMVSKVVEASREPAKWG